MPGSTWGGIPTPGRVRALPEPAFILQLLSAPEVRATDRDAVVLSAGKPLALLAYLSVERRPVPREELAAVLWPDADGPRARASARQALWTLRQALGQECFASDDPIVLAQGVVETDLALLVQALEDDDLGAADRLWKGPPLHDLEFPRAKGWNRWVDEVRGREEARFGEALVRAAASELGRGRPQAAVRWLRRAVEVQPYKPAHRLALGGALLDASQFSDAALAIAEARSAATGPDQHADLDALDDRLATLRFGSAGAHEPPTLKTEFVGRATEFSKLSRKWRKARTGESQVALVLGPPGIGKTRLAEELAVVAESDGGRTLSVKAVEVERSMDWGMASELVRNLHGLPGAAGISNRSASVLARLVPSLAGWKDTFPLGGDGPTGEAAAATDALLDLVCAVAEEAPLLLVVDDLQWVDKLSRAALSHLARAAGREPVMVLFTCRTGEGDPEVAKALDSLMRLPGTDPVELGPLEASEVSELLVLLMEPMELEYLHDLAGRLFAITRGNPLFIVEILKLLQAEGLMEVGGGGKWRMSPASLDEPLPVPKTVESAIRRHLDDLGPAARHLAAHLAQQARPLPPEELRRLSRLDPFEVSEGLRQLFERDLVRRNPDGKLQFVHDAVEEAARKHLRADGRELGGGLEGGVEVGWRESRRWREPGWWKTREGLWVMGVAAVALVALVLGMWQGEGGLLAGLRSAPVPTYPYGQGRLWVPTQGGAIWVIPPSREEGEWRVEEAAVPFPHPVLKGPVRTTDGGTRWFVQSADGPEAPPFIGIPQADGGVEPLLKIDGDVGFHDLSPDGRYALLGRQNLEVEHYAQDLVAVDMESREVRTLFRAREMITGSGWAQDGQRIAFVERGARDTLRIVAPDGTLLGSFGFGEVSYLADLHWCGDSDHLVFQAVLGGLPALGLFQFSTGAHRILESRVLGLRYPRCVGDGQGVVATGFADGDGHVVFLDTQQDTVFYLPGTSSMVRSGLWWVPDTLPPVVQSMDIQGGEVSLSVGERAPLSAVGLFSDGSSRPLAVTWESKDPSVASVDSTGVVVANHPGSVTVAARLAGWLEDTVRLDIGPADDSELLFRDGFSSGTLDRWEQFGYPPSELVEVDGARVLSMNGDGRYLDGVFARQTFTLRTGASAEVQFRLLLTQTDRQRILLCIEAVRSVSRWEQGDPQEIVSGGSVCARYPLDENVKFDPRGASLAFEGTGHTEYISLPDQLHLTGWTSMVLQVRPDGEVALVLNGVRVHEALMKLSIPEGTRWRIKLVAASENTHLHVRSVTVWPGQRY
jgi:DNA-binding SARP family transcriptional activator